jgi:alkylation response protein AidB-like acyl-CoA dehydrogenase
MGEWVADSSETIDGSNIHLWIIPANASGRWRWEAGGEGYEMRIDQQFQRLFVHMGDGGAYSEVVDASLSGRRLEVVLTGTDSQSQRMLLRGTVDGDTITGMLIDETGAKSRWHARRVGGTHL